MNDMKQTAVAFGPEGTLVGVLTTPTGSDPKPVACLMLNMGANHRVGPHRINVKLAHRLAALGVSSLRFDLAGLGDSAPPSGSEHFTTQAVHDLQAAMELMESTLGIRQFLVIGLCSGAANALSVAVIDARVVGILMFDGYGFPGRRSRWERTLRRALAAPTNPAFVGKAMRWVKRQLAPRSGAADMPHIFDEVQPTEVVLGLFRRSMTQLVARGVSVYLLYSGTLHVRDRGRDQLGPFAGEPFAQQLEYEFVREIDHTLTSLASQERFMTAVTHWVMRVAAKRMTWASSAGVAEFDLPLPPAATRPLALL